MGTFICEKCGKLDNTACKNNYWHASGNKYSKSQGEKVIQYYKPEFAYFEDHVCCSDCCKGVAYSDGSGALGNGKFDIKDKQHWTEIGKEELLEWEARKDGSMLNATEYFNTICEYLEPDESGDICHAGEDMECLDPFGCTAVQDIHGNPLVSEETGMDRETEGFY